MFPTDDHLKSIRVLLEILVLVSNLAVWYGVYLERDKFPKETQDRGWLLLVRGLAAELAFGAFLFVADTTLSDRQANTLEGQRTETARAELETERVKQTVQWRIISQKQIDIMRSELAKASGSFTLAFLLGDPETQLFALQITRAFTDPDKQVSLMQWKGLLESRTYPDRVLFGLIVPGSENSQVIAVRKALTAAGIPFSTDDIPDPPPLISVGDGLTYTPGPKATP